MTDTLIEMKRDLELFSARRRQCEKDLAVTSDPGERAFLQETVTMMLEHEEKHP